MDEVFLFEFQNEQKIIYHSPLNDHIFELSSNLEDKPYPDSQWQTVDITKQLGIAAICEFYFLSGYIHFLYPLNFKDLTVTRYVFRVKTIKKLVLFKEEKIATGLGS